MDFELPMLGQLSSDFYATGISAMDTGSDIIKGRPYGGLAFLWRKSLGTCCNIVTYDDDKRLLGLEIKNETIECLILNVYMPFCCNDNVDEFLLYVNRINNIICTADSPVVYAMGDFNADFVKGQLFGDELVTFCRDVNLIITDKLYLSGKKTFSYFSEAHSSTSWLDHILSTSSAHSLVTDVRIGYEFVTSDHLPIFMDIKTECNLYNLMPESNLEYNKCKLQWDKVSPMDIKHYMFMSENNLKSIVVDEGLSKCSDVTCCDEKHKKAIDELYDNIIQALSNAGSELQSRVNKGHTNVVPGWNEICKDVHTEAREAFLSWRANGSKKNGYIFETMKCTRARFKLVLRHCKINKDNIVADSIAKKFMSRDTKAFWAEIQRVSNKKVKVCANTIDEITGNEKVCEFWHDYYKKLLNTCEDFSSKEHVLKGIEKGCETENVSSNMFTPLEIENAIKVLKKGKSPGLDGVSSEQFLFAHHVINELFCTLINSAIMHGYLPIKALETLLVPIVKDKKGDITNSDNYRPIAIATISSKIIEISLLNKYMKYLSTNDNQCGFKPKHSTDMCIFLLKEVIDYYNAHSSPVYLCFMDATKAFDRVNHWHLFKKLITRGVPSVIVRLLSNWYSTQMFIVKWCEVKSTPFNVSNGVRQGGVLSPYLYNVFMDDLSSALNKSKIGCIINNNYINHLCYADDSVLIAPSPTGLQYLIDMCQNYGFENEVLYNIKKTKCMCIKPDILKNLYVPNVFLNAEQLSWTHEHKYLGVFLCNDRSDGKDMYRQMRSIYAKGNLLLRSFRKCTVPVKENIFKTYFSDFYCNQLWCNYPSQLYRKVKTAFNNVFRFFMGIPRYLRISVSKEFVSRHMDSFDVIMRKSSANLRNRLYTSKNNLVNNIINSHFFLFKSNINTMWRKRIFMNVL
jgi:hypothetical protein